MYYKEGDVHYIPIQRSFNYTVTHIYDSRLPKVLMRGQLVGQNCRGRPRIVWNDVVLFDIHKSKLWYTCDALNKLVWRGLTCVART